MWDRENMAARVAELVAAQVREFGRGILIGCRWAYRPATSI